MTTALVAVLLAVCATTGKLDIGLISRCHMQGNQGASLKWLPVVICGFSPAVLQQISDPLTLLLKSTVSEAAMLVHIYIKGVSCHRLTCYINSFSSCCTIARGQLHCCP